MPELDWEHQGRWADEQMPPVDNLITSFFGWRESGDISLDEAIQNVGEITFGYISWEFRLETLPGRGNTIPLPYVEIYVSIDNGHTWKKPLWDSLLEIWQIEGLSNESQLKVKAYIRSDFIDILPWELTKLLEIKICVSNRRFTWWDTKGRPETVWEIVQNLNT